MSLSALALGFLGTGTIHEVFHETGILDRDRDIVGQRHCDGQLCVLVWPEICGTCLTLGDMGPGNLVTRPLRGGTPGVPGPLDRKSTRLNSSH